MKKWSSATRVFLRRLPTRTACVYLLLRSLRVECAACCCQVSPHSSHNLKCVVSSFAKSPVSIVRRWKLSQAVLTELRDPVVIYAFWIPNMFTSSNFKLFNRWWVEHVCVFIILPHWGPNTFCHYFMQKNKTKTSLTPDQLVAAKTYYLWLLVWPLFKSLSSRQFHSPNSHQLQCLDLGNLHFFKA